MTGSDGKKIFCWREGTVFNRGTDAFWTGRDRNSRWTAVYDHVHHTPLSRFPVVDISTAIGVVPVPKKVGLENINRVWIMRYTPSVLYFIRYSVDGKGR